MAAGKATYKIVLVSGFESFNRNLYGKVGKICCVEFRAFWFSG